MALSEVRFAEFLWTTFCHSLWLLPMISFAIAPSGSVIEPARADRRMRYAILACLILPLTFAGFHLVIREGLTQKPADRANPVVAKSSTVFARPDFESRDKKATSERPDRPSPEILSWRTIVRNSAPWIVSAWATVAVIMILRLVVGAIALRLFLGAKPASPAVRAESDSLARSMKLKRTPRICVSDRIVQPMLVGLFRSRIVLPARWLAEYGADLREAVLAHELAHASRFDLVYLMTAKLAAAAWFFHPAMHRLSRQAALWRELAADEMAIEATGKPVTFALALESVAIWASERGSGSCHEFSALTFSTSRPNRHLRYRVEAALNPQGASAMNLSGKKIRSISIASVLMSASAIVAIEAAPFDSLAKVDGKIAGELSVQYEIPKSQGPRIRFDVRLLQIDEKDASALLGKDLDSIGPNPQSTGFVIDDATVEKLTNGPETSTADFPKVTCNEGDVVRLRRDSKLPAIVGFGLSKTDRSKYRNLPEKTRLLDPKLEDTESWTNFGLEGISESSDYRLKLEGSDRELRWVKRGSGPRLTTVSFQSETKVPKGKSMAYVLGIMPVIIMDNPEIPPAKEYLGGGIELLGRNVARIVIVKPHAGP